MRSVKQECLSKVILFGERPLLRVLTEYGRHYHYERNHQGKGNRLLFPDQQASVCRFGPNIVCRQRLRGLLKYYQRAAGIFLPNGQGGNAGNPGAPDYAPR